MLITIISAKINNINMGKGQPWMCWVALVGSLTERFENDDALTRPVTTDGQIQSAVFFSFLAMEYGNSSLDGCDGR